MQPRYSLIYNAIMAPFLSLSVVPHHKGNTFPSLKYLCKEISADFKAIKDLSPYVREQPKVTDVRVTSTCESKNDLNFFFF